MTKSKYQNHYLSVEKTTKLLNQERDHLREYAIAGLTFDQAYKDFSSRRKDIDNRSRKGSFRAIYENYEPQIKIQIVTVDGRPVNRGKSYGDVVSQTFFFTGTRPLTDSDTGDLIAPLTLIDHENQYGMLRSGTKNRIDWEAAFHTRSIRTLSASEKQKLVHSKGELIAAVQDLIVSGAGKHHHKGGKHSDNKEKKLGQLKLELGGE